jgi:hypothetical protein
MFVQRSCASSHACHAWSDAVRTVFYLLPRLSEDDRAGRTKFGNEQEVGARNAFCYSSEAVKSKSF